MLSYFFLAVVSNYYSIFSELYAHSFNVYYFFLLISKIYQNIAVLLDKTKDFLPFFVILKNCAFNALFLYVFILITEFINYARITS